MQEEKLISVGIDVGTSTTQCVFSELTLKNTASVFSAPRIQISDKRVLYRAPVKLTPLLNGDTIDAEKLTRMVSEDYSASGIQPKDIRLGAVIITGETAKKKNARAVTQALSSYAGDFVVATAGPALESILAGRGSGSAALSEKTGRKVLNFDIGGGTTNMALFDHGMAVADGCLNIGGRLLRFHDDDHTVLSYTEDMNNIALDIGIKLEKGKKLGDHEIETLCNRMAKLLDEAAGLCERSPLHDQLVLEHSLPKAIEPEIVTFSGGVADCIYQMTSDTTAFHDLGLYLGRAINSSDIFSRLQVQKPSETSHATVIGAGAYSVSISGSTIFYQNMLFPVLSLPAAKIHCVSESDIRGLAEAVAEQLRVYDNQCAICMDGIRAPSFPMVEAIADQLSSAMINCPNKIIILQEDMAKALGQSLARRWPKDSSFLCMDGISLSYGDTVDIGAPLSDGRVVPVIIKTFAFSNDNETGR